MPLHLARQWAANAQFSAARTHSIGGWQSNAQSWWKGQLTAFCLMLYKGIPSARYKHVVPDHAASSERKGVKYACRPSKTGRQMRLTTLRNLIWTVFALLSQTICLPVAMGDHC